MGVVVRVVWSLSGDSGRRNDTAPDLGTKVRGRFVRGGWPPSSLAPLRRVRLPI